MAPECSHMITICHFPFWFHWKHLSRLPKLWNFHLVDSKCFQIKFITNKFLFTGRCHFQLSNIRIRKLIWMTGDYDYLRGAASINHQVALRANFKMYSRPAKGGEKGDPNRTPWLAKMACFGAWWYLDVTWYLVLRCYQNGDFQNFKIDLIPLSNIIKR